MQAEGTELPPGTLEQVLYRQGGPLRLLGRSVRVCEPCVGIGGLRRLVQLAGGLYQATAAYDIDSSLAHFYSTLRKHEQDEGVQNVHIGKDKGNLLSLKLSDVVDCEALIAGPPCQPWAGTGKGQGSSDPRADVFDFVINLIIDQSWRGMLLLVVLENSSRLRKTQYFAEVMNRLRAAVPFFIWEDCQSELSEVFPHHRERVWLRGMRRDAMLTTELPRPLESQDLGCWIPLETLLDDTPQPVNPAELGWNQACNLAGYLKKLETDIEKGQAGRIAMLELDRSPLKTFGGNIQYDRCVALRASGPKVFVVASSEVGKPWHEHTLHRFLSLLSLEERCRLQGHDGSLALHFPNQAAAKKGTGNAFHPLQLGMMYLPMLKEAFLTGALKKEGPHTLTKKELLELVPDPSEPSYCAELPEEKEEYDFEADLEAFHEWESDLPETASPVFSCACPMMDGCSSSSVLSEAEPLQDREDRQTAEVEAGVPAPICPAAASTLSPIMQACQEALEDTEPLSRMQESILQKMRRSQVQDMATPLRKRRRVKGPA